MIDAKELWQWLLWKFIFFSSSSDIVDLFFPLYAVAECIYRKLCAYLRDTYKSTVHNILNMLRKKPFLWFIARDMKKNCWESDVEIKHRPASMFIHLMSLNGIHLSTRSFSFQCCFCFSRFFPSHCNDGQWKYTRWNFYKIATFLIIFLLEMTSIYKLNSL